MITRTGIIEQLNLLLAEKVSLDNFEDWLVLRSWDMHRDISQEAQDLTWSIELNLSEYYSDHLDEDELRAELGKILAATPL